MYRTYIKRFAAAAVLFLTAASILSAEDVLTSGHRAGEFTMDMDAALRYAQNRNKPVFINFTGSDWCGWCQLMARQVFSKQAWSDYAEDNLALVTLDFPQDENIVPEKWKSRNQQLQYKYGIRGFPTYVILDSDGKTELGRLGAGQDKTPASFIAEIEKVTRFAKSSLDSFTSRLSGNLRQEYERNLSILADLTADLSQEGTQEKISSVFTRLESIQMEYIYGQMSSAEKKLYDSARSSLNEAVGDLNAWLETEPVRNDENNRIYGEFISTISVSRETLDTLTAKYY